MRIGRGAWLIVAAGMLLTGCARTAQAPPPAPQPAAAPAPTPTAQAPAAPSTPAATAPAAPATASFTDISGTFAEQTIKDMASLGVFDSTTGEFKPNAPITRSEFVRWLVKANNAYYKDTPDQQIRLAESGTATFVDVPAGNPDFPYIQGMANAGYVIGTDATHFTPDRAITREEMIAIKASRDEHGMNMDPVDPMFIPYADKAKVAKVYTGAIHEDDSVRTSHNIARVWGAIKTFNPQMPVTRAEAAVCLSEFGGEIPDVTAAKASGRVK
jgi:hypothetical protein